jgi:RND family efflux transporter MFP subunit
MLRYPLVVLGFISCLSNPVWANAAPLQTAPAEKQVLPDVYVADAIIEAVQQATVAAETSGRIKSINFDVDDVVDKGAVLLRFTDTQQRANLAKAEAAQKEAEARLREAQAEYERVKSVFARKLVAKSALDKAEADLKAAKERVNAAQAGVAQAKEQLEYTIVRAPYAGIVTERLVEVGEQARPGTPLMRGFSLEKLRVTASVPQTVVEAVRAHGQVTVYESFPESDGAIVSKDITVYPYADAQTHRFTVRADLPKAHGQYYPGMFAKAAFVIGERERLMVPAKAVVHRSEVTAVYVVDADGRIDFRQVRVGDRLPEGKREILAGLAAGEQVALDPVSAGVALKQQRAGTH